MAASLLARDSQSLPDSKRNSNEHAKHDPVDQYRAVGPRCSLYFGTERQRPWDAGRACGTVTMAMGFGGLGLITVFMDPMKTELGWFAEPIRSDAFH